MTAEWQAAVIGGSIASLTRLLDDGADIDARDRFGQTGLMVAAHRGDARVVEWLATRGADLDHTAKHGLTAIMLAAIGGHAHAVRVLVGAGARTDLRASGAFADQTVRDIAVARGDAAVLDALGAAVPAAPRPAVPAFVIVDSWTAAAALLAFAPCAPVDTAGHVLAELRIHVRDHRGRERAPDRRSLEAHYVAFSFSQSLHAPDEARRLAFETSYGRAPFEVTIAGVRGRAYAAGPVPEPDDVDGQSPAVVVWHDGPVLLFLASLALSPARLVAIGETLAPAHD